MGIAPIPFTSIDRYGERHGIEGEELTFFIRMICAMDEVAISHVRQEQPSSGKAKPEGRSLSPELFDAIWG